MCVCVCVYVLQIGLLYYMDDITKTYPINEYYQMKIAIVFVVAGHCAREILLARIIGELYAQVSFFPTTGPETG